MYSSLSFFFEAEEDNDHMDTAYSEYDCHSDSEQFLENEEEAEGCFK